MRRAAIALVALSASLTACAEDEEVTAPTGTYEVQSHTRTEMTCDGAGEQVEEIEFFALELDEFFGTSLLGWHDCTSATSCEEDASITQSFTHEGGEWRLRSTLATGLEDCQGTIEEGVVIETEEGVEIELRSFTGTIALESGEECDTDIVDAHEDDLSCTTLEVIRGRSL